MIFYTSFFSYFSVYLAFEQHHNAYISFNFIGLNNTLIWCICETNIMHFRKQWKIFLQYTSLFMFKCRRVKNKKNQTTTHNIIFYAWIFLSILIQTNFLYISFLSFANKHAIKSFKNSILSRSRFQILRKRRDIVRNYRYRFAFLLQNLRLVVFLRISNWNFLAKFLESIVSLVCITDY